MKGKNIIKDSIYASIPSVVGCIAAVKNYSKNYNLFNAAMVGVGVDFVINTILISFDEAYKNSMKKECEYHIRENKITKKGTKLSKEENNEVEKTHSDFNDSNTNDSEESSDEIQYDVKEDDKDYVESDPLKFVLKPLEDSHFEDILEKNMEDITNPNHVTFIIPKLVLSIIQREVKRYKPFESDNVIDYYTDDQYESIIEKILSINDTEYATTDYASLCKLYTIMKNCESFDLHIVETEKEIAEIESGEDNNYSNGYFNCTNICESIKSIICFYAYPENIRKNKIKEIPNNAKKFIPIVRSNIGFWLDTHSDLKPIFLQNEEEEIHKNLFIEVFAKCEVIHKILKVLSIHNEEYEFAERFVEALLNVCENHDKLSFFIDIIGNEEIGYGVSTAAMDKRIDSQLFISDDAMNTINGIFNETVKYLADKEFCDKLFVMDFDEIYSIGKDVIPDNIKIEFFNNLKEKFENTNMKEGQEIMFKNIQEKFSTIINDINNGVKSIKKDIKEDLAKTETSEKKEPSKKLSKNTETKKASKTTSKNASTTDNKISSKKSTSSSKSKDDASEEAQKESLKSDETVTETIEEPKE